VISTRPSIDCCSYSRKVLALTSAALHLAGVDAALMCGLFRRLAWIGRTTGSRAHETHFHDRGRLEDLTKRGELVLDPFLGSGSTLIAAQNTGRVCCGIARDPLYVDVIIRSYEALTGSAAILADSAKTFEQVASRRRDEDHR
jgi:hypothetical protein